MNDKKLLEKKIDRETMYEGLIFDVVQHEVALPNGQTALRDVVYNPDAAAVVAIDEDMNVIMVRQYRIADDRITLEIPAGKCDQGETIETCAVRELQEETGYIAGSISLLHSALVSPGFSTERIYVYYGTGLTMGRTNPDEDEFVEVVKIPLKDVIEMVEENTIQDGKTIIGILAVARLQKV